MSVTIELYKMTSDRRKAKKTMTKVGSDITNVKLKEPCDQVDPSFILNLSTTDFNYIKVVEWNRFYFLKKPPTFERGGLHSLDCHEDILSTVWSSLSTLNAHVERSENKGTEYIIDELLGLETSRSIKPSQAIGTLGTPSGAYIALTVTGGV